MANSYNSNPIIINTDMGAGWKSLQTLNAGNLPSNVQQRSGAVARQPGFHLSKIEISVGIGTPTAGVITVVDPNDSTLLFQSEYPAFSTGQAPITFDFEGMSVAWRDFQLTGTGTNFAVARIWYRI